MKATTSTVLLSLAALTTAQYQDPVTVYVTATASGPIATALPPPPPANFLPPPSGPASTVTYVLPPPGSTSASFPGLKLPKINLPNPLKNRLCGTSNSSPLISDCTKAINDLHLLQTVCRDQSNPSDNSRVGAYGSCAVVWTAKPGKNCVSGAELKAAAGGLLTCWGLKGGSPLVEGSWKLGKTTVSLVKNDAPPAPAYQAPVYQAPPRPAQPSYVPPVPAQSYAPQQQAPAQQGWSPQGYASQQPSYQPQQQYQPPPPRANPQYPNSYVGANGVTYVNVP
jgi:hypothetical protein